MLRKTLTTMECASASLQLAPRGQPFLRFLHRISSDKMGVAHSCLRPPELALSRIFQSQVRYLEFRKQMLCYAR